MRRIALYSHDTMGLGHIRRNLLIAQHLAAQPNSAAILLVTGVGPTSLVLPVGVDCLSLPALCKKNGSGYGSRSLRISTPSLIALRSRIIRAAIEEFDPDVLVVDKVPRGVLRELDPTLDWIRATGHTRCVLGLRDVLDEPAVVRSEWRRDDTESAIAHFYDSIWVYGDRNVYDVSVQCGWPRSVRAKLHFTGYLDARVRTAANGMDAPQPAKTTGRLAVCLVGGGEDGDRLAVAFARSDLPADMQAVIVAGPFMPADLYESLCRATAHHPQFQVLRYMEEPSQLLKRADRVIAMGGYNTVCELLCHGKPALIVPRIKPRREQWIRANRMAQLGLLDVLHPDRLSPARLSDWLTHSNPPAQSRSDRIDFNGLNRIASLMDCLCHERFNPRRGVVTKGSESLFCA